MGLTDLNHGLTTGFDAWLFLLRALPEWLQIAMTGLAASVWMLLSCRACRQVPLWLRTDAPKTLQKVGSVPHERDPGAPQRTGSRDALNGLRHFCLPLLPFLVLCLPVAAIVAQTEAHFGWRGAEPGAPLIIGATLTATSSADQRIGKREANLQLPAGIRLDAPPLRVDRENTILWRIRAEHAGEFPIRIQVGNSEAELVVDAGESFSALAPWHFRTDDLRALAYPGAKPLAVDAGFQSTMIDYSRRTGDFFGLSRASWQLLGFAFVFAYLLRRIAASNF